MIIEQEIIEKADLPPKAVKILEEPDRKIQFKLRKHVPEGKIVDCYVVYHSTARAPPCKGGIRMSEDVSMEETAQLAEIMSYKNALMGLPFGGGKSGIATSRNHSPELKGRIIAGYTHEIREQLYSGAYVPAPDIGTGPAEMAEIFGETHVRASVTGKPVYVGGLPGRKEATGYGVTVAAKQAARDILNLDISDLTVAIQGYGNVGYWAGKFLQDSGTDIVAVADSSGATFIEEGIDADDLKKYKREEGSVSGYKGSSISGQELLGLDVDILIPAAIGGVITKDVAEEVQADLIVEGANAPVTSEGDEVLVERNIPVVPDILANAGGVVASYVEWRGGKSGSKTKEAETYQTISENITEAFYEVLKISDEEDLNLRKSALTVATLNLRNTMYGLGWI